MHPGAEQIVITAAFRALASMYHPDRWKGDQVEANRRMSEINVAYDILGNSSNRAKYDKSRGSSTTSMDQDEESVDQAFDSAMSELETRWQIAASVVPELSAVRKRLEKIAHRLAFSFVVVVLDGKKFQSYAEIASLLEAKFLEDHFGADPKIIRFAKTLIELGRRDAIRGLNKYVDVMGSDVDADLIINRVTKDFSIDLYQAGQKKSLHLEKLKKDVRAGYLDSSVALVQESKLVVEEVGGTFFENSKFSIYKRVDFGISKGEKILDSVTMPQFIRWVQSNLC